MPRRWTWVEIPHQPSIKKREEERARKCQSETDRVKPPVLNRKHRAAPQKVSTWKDFQGDNNMSTQNTAVAATATEAPAQATAAAEGNEPETAANSKEQVYIELGEMVQTKTGKRVGKTGGRLLFDHVVNRIFQIAVKEGSFRFNGGMGSLHVKTYSAGSRRLPSGQSTSFGERNKVRYEEGVIVKALIGNGGDLEAALKARGDGKEKPAPKAKAVAKPAKAAAAKPAAPAKPAPAKPTPAAAQTAAAVQSNSEGDLDLA